MSGRAGIDAGAAAIDIRRSALIVVDMQNDFCHDDGVLAKRGIDVRPTHRGSGHALSVDPLQLDAV